MVTKYCDNCLYRGKVAGMPCCEFYLRTNRRRPCPAGDGCTVKIGIDVKRKKRKNAKNSAIDGQA